MRNMRSLSVCRDIGRFKNTWLLVTFTLSIVGAAVIAQASTITRCGASKGFAWYFESGLVEKRKTGWTKDGVSKGDITLVRDGDEYDIIFTDATGGTSSAKANGAEVLFLGGTRPFVILEAYTKTQGLSVFTYTFDLDDHGAGQVVYSATKLNGLINKAAIYKAECTGK